MESLIHKLETFEYEDLLDWLASALAGSIPLSGGITPDQSPAADLYHIFKDVQGHPDLGLSIKRAVGELLDRFSAAPGWGDSGYEKQLLLLAGFKEFDNAAPRLAPLVRNAERFRSLPPIARRIVLNTLHDLPGSDDPALWIAAAKVDPAMLAPISFSALLRRQKVNEAISVIRRTAIPNEPAIAKSIGTRLRLSTPDLSRSAKQALVMLASNLRLPGKALILSEIRQWRENQSASISDAAAVSPWSIGFERFLEGKAAPFHVPPSRFPALVPEAGIENELCPV